MLQTPFERSGEQTSRADGDTFLHDLSESADVIVEQIGHDTSDNPMYSATVGTGPARVAVIAAVHGNEPAPRESAFAFLRDMAYAATPTTATLANQFSWTFLPTANPSGIQYGTRTPAFASIDINRDYIDQQLPESQAIATWLTDHRPALVLDLHEHTHSLLTGPLSTGRQTHPGINPALRDLSNGLHEAIGARMNNEGHEWSRYPDSLVEGTARNETGRIYKATCVLFESDRTIDYQTRVDVTQTGLDEAGQYWLTNAQAFEDAHNQAAHPSPSGLYYTDGSPALLPGVQLYFADGTPLTST